MSPVRTYNSGTRRNGPARPTQRAPEYPLKNTRKTDMRRYLGIALALFTVTLAACNTMAGFGQDLSKGGNAITNSAEKAK
jgi:entericidin B